MRTHAVTALVVIAVAAAITLLFGTRGYNAAMDPNADITDAVVAYQQCDALLMTLNNQLADALTDEANRAERFAAAMSPAESACTKAEAAIRVAYEQHRRDVQIGHMRKKTVLGQQWLRELSKALAAYEVAAKQGSAANEMAALQTLLQ